MSNDLKSDTKSNPKNEDTIGVLSHTETDALLNAVRPQVLQGTFKSDDLRILKQLVECLGDSRGMIRLAFAETLGKIGKPAVPVLIEALANHSNVVVRRASGKTLTLIADPIAIPHLIEALLNDEDTVVKGSAVGALARMGEAAVPVLLEILASPEHPESTKGHAAWAMAFIGAEAKELVYQEIGSDSIAVRAAVVGAVAKIAQEDPDDKAFEILINALDDAAENVRSEAAAALGNVAYQPAVPHLILLLQHGVGETRKSAALALMKIGQAEGTDAALRGRILEPLKTALEKESEPSIQQVFKLAVSQIERQSDDDDDDW